MTIFQEIIVTILLDFHYHLCGIKANQDLRNRVDTIKSGKEKE